MSLKKDFGRRMELLREERRFSRTDVGRLVRFESEQSMVGKLERGEVNTRTDVIEEIAHALGLEPLDLFTFPWKSNLRHQIGEMIRGVPHEKLSGLKEVIERYLEQLEQAPKSATERLRGRSR